VCLFTHDMRGCGQMAWTAFVRLCSAASKVERARSRKSSRTPAPYTKALWPACRSWAKCAARLPRTDEADRTEDKEIRGHQGTEGKRCTVKTYHALSGPGRLLRRRLLNVHASKTLSFTSTRADRFEPCGRIRLR